MDELTKKRMERRRELAAKKERWTPKEALENALLDMELGYLVNVEAITIIASVRHEDPCAECGVKSFSKIHHYIGSDGHTGPKEIFWIFGLVQRWLIDWGTD